MFCIPQTMERVKYTDPTQYCSQTAIWNLRPSGVFTTPSMFYKCDHYKWGGWMVLNSASPWQKQ